MLHTVNKSPYNSNSLKTCMGYLQSEDALLLIEDGVYAAMKGGESEALIGDAGGKVYALEPDLKARGIASDKLIDGIEVVGFDGFVKLAADNDKVQSWL